MKGFRPTWVLSALVVLLAAYTYYEFRNSNADLDEGKGERFASAFKREDIDDIQIVQRGALLHLHKDGDVWKLKTPVQDFGESAVIDGFLFSVVTQKFRPFRSDEDQNGKAVNWADYGLEPAAITLELTAKGKSEKLSFGSKTAFDGSYYVRQGDEILLGDRGLGQILEKQPSSFRSRKLWREDDVTVESVRVEDGTGKSSTPSVYTLKKDGDKWVVDPAVPYAVDGAKVHEWIGKLQDLTPGEFVSENLSDADKNTYLLKKPAMSVQLNYKNKDGKDGQWILTLGQDRGSEVFLYTNQRPTVYKVMKAGVDKLIVPKEYFRDGRTPFDFNVELARTVKIRTPALSQDIKKVDSNWILDGAKAGEGMEVDQDKLIKLFQSLHGLEAQEFLSGGGATVRSPPQIEILGADGKPIFSMIWGDEYKPKSPWVSAAGQAFRYVKSSLAKETLGLPKDKIDRLIDVTLVKKKTPPAADAHAGDGSSQKKSVEK